ncbi:MAG: hypothetical protein U5L96_17535 [Owenweeksia sp.]|nr:hypothetical protein [Owenweeksia sp.]
MSSKPDDGNRNTLDALYQEYHNAGALVIFIDEFGKFLRTQQNTILIRSYIFTAAGGASQ